MLVAHHLAHFGSSLTDTFDIQRLALDFTQLNTEAAQFYLSINTTDVL